MQNKGFFGALFDLSFSEFITTNTIDQSRSAGYPKITVLSVARLFSEAIAAIHMGTSVSKLFG